MGMHHEQKGSDQWTSIYWKLLKLQREYTLSIYLCFVAGPTAQTEALSMYYQKQRSMSVNTYWKCFNQTNSLLPYMQIEPKWDRSLWQHGTFNEGEKNTIIFKTMPEIVLVHVDESAHTCHDPLPDIIGCFKTMEAIQIARNEKKKNQRDQERYPPRVPAQTAGSQHFSEHPRRPGDYGSQSRPRSPSLNYGGQGAAACRGGDNHREGNNRFVCIARQWGD